MTNSLVPVIIFLYNLINLFCQSQLLDKTFYVSLNGTDINNIYCTQYEPCSTLSYAINLRQSHKLYINVKLFEIIINDINHTKQTNLLPFINMSLMLTFNNKNNSYLYNNNNNDDDDIRDYIFDGEIFNLDQLTVVS